MSLKNRKNQYTGTGTISYAEIARAAGVSPGLISAFFSGNHYSSERKSGIGISPAKRRKIIETCHKLYYIPDTPYAFYRLYPEKADVGVMLNDDVGDGFSNPYHSLLFEGLAKRAIETGVEVSNLFFKGMCDYLVRPEAIPNAIQNGSVNKLAIMSRPNCSLIYRLLKMDVSLVTVGQAIPMDGVVSVVPDFFEAARIAIHKLHEHGHRTIAIGEFPIMPRPESYNGRELRLGVEQAFRELGMPFNESYIFNTPPGFNHEDLKVFLAQLPLPPTAIFCFDDHLARTVSHALEDAGFSVPGDISLIGCNDDRINREVRPGLSTIHLPCVQVGKRAFDELSRIAVEGRPQQYERIVLPVEFLDRGSIRSLPV